MTFILFKIAWAILRPGNLIAISLAVGVLFWLLGGGRWRRLGTTLTVAASAFLFAFLFIPLGTLVTRPLENHVPPVALPQSIDGIVILGGTVKPARTQKNNRPGLNESGERLVEGMALARQFPDARVVFTGGTIALFSEVEAEAVVARVVFEQLGFGGAQFVYESRSRNTRENAIFSKALAEPQPGETWVLLTSAAHMPRALAVFEAVDWPMLPMPVDYRSGDWSEPLYDMVVTEELELFEYGVREWLGLTAYNLRGWTRSFWPENGVGTAAQSSG